MAFSIRRTRELGTIGVSTPSGALMPFAGNSSPAGWLLCYGQAISRADYPALFSVLGTTYGSGDGSTTFNLPDLRGRVVAGVDNMGGTAASRLTNTVLSASNTLGATGGSQTHILTEPEMPSHTHTQVAHKHGLNVARKMSDRYIDVGTYWGGGTSPDNGQYGSSDFANGVTVTGEYLTSVAPTINPSGSSNAHTNTQPTIVMNYIIKV
jgi:microcystin-dependent protein